MDYYLKRIKIGNIFFIGCFLVFLFPARIWSKDSLKFSSFSQAEIETLGKDKTLANRTTLKSIPTAMAVETLSFIGKSPKTVVDELLRWNPTKHQFLDIVIHENLSEGEGFGKLRLSEKEKRHQWLIKAGSSQEDLNLSQSEFKRLTQAGDDEGKVADVWRGVLASRHAAYREKGVNGLGAYQFKKGVFSPNKQISWMFSEMGPVQEHFTDLLALLWRNQPYPDMPFSEYWEEMDLNNEGVYLLGMVRTLNKGSSWQVADFQYYVSSNYFVSLTLYEILPFEGGSLIWRGDYVLSPIMLELKGVERMFSENVLLQQVKKAIGAFKDDIEAK